jgi:hypothetical protein
MFGLFRFPVVDVIMEPWQRPQRRASSHSPSSTAAKKMAARLADIPALPGVTAYGRTKQRATAAVQALA